MVNVVQFVPKVCVMIGCGRPLEPNSVNLERIVKVASVGVVRQAFVAVTKQLVRLACAIQIVVPHASPKMDVDPLGIDESFDF